MTRILADMLLRYIEKIQKSEYLARIHEQQNPHLKTFVNGAVSGKFWLFFHNPLYF